eukprot:470146_1
MSALIILLLYTFTYIISYGQTQSACDSITTCEDCVNSDPGDGCQWILSEQNYFPPCDNYESNQSKYRYNWASSKNDCPTVFDSIAFQAIVPSVAAILCICCAMFIVMKCRRNKVNQHSQISPQESNVMISSQQPVYMVPQGQVMLVQPVNQPPQYVTVQPVNIISNNGQAISQNK